MSLSSSKAIHLALLLVALMLLSCGDGKKKVAGGWSDETETSEVKVSGVLYDMDEKPLARQVVLLNQSMDDSVLSPEDARQLVDTTDAAGLYSFSKVHSGVWYLYIQNAQGGLIRSIPVKAIDIDAGKDTLASLQLISLIRDQLGSDSVWVPQLHKLFVLTTDTLEITVPQGVLDLVPVQDGALTPAIPTSSISTSSSSGNSSMAISAASEFLSSESVSSSSGFSSSIGVSSSSVNVTGSLLLRYLFDDIVDPFADSSGNGIYLQAAVGSSYNLSSGSISFQGANCLTSPYNTTMVTSSPRVDARVKLTAGGSRIQGIFCHDDGDDLGDNWCLRRRGNDTLEFRYQVSVYAAESVSVGGVTLDTWMTVSAELTSAKVANLYLEGINVATLNAASGFFGAFPTNYSVGCTNSTLADPQYFTGSIDSLRLSRP